MLAGRVDALGAGLEDVDGEGLRVAPLDLRDARANGVARQPAADEDHEPVQPRDAVAAVGERVDPELDLIVDADGSSHAPMVRNASLAATTKCLAPNRALSNRAAIRAIRFRRDAERPVHPSAIRLRCPLDPP